jgi:hypothetical protein
VPYSSQAGGGGEFVVRNFVGVIRDISIEASTVETDLFPKGALEYYTKKNMGWEYTQEEYDTWQLAERGGAQGVCVCVMCVCWRRLWFR